MHCIAALRSLASLLNRRRRRRSITDEARDDNRDDKASSYRGPEAANSAAAHHPISYPGAPSGKLANLPLRSDGWPRINQDKSIRRITTTTTH